MQPNTQFKINSIEELKEAYNHLDFKYFLNYEIKDFKEYEEYRYVCCNKDGWILLDLKHNDYQTIPNPFKKSKQQGIDKAMNDLSKEAKKLGFAVEVVFKSL